MHKHARRLKWFLTAFLMGGWLLQYLGPGVYGCEHILDRELEAVFRPEANPYLIRDSYLVDLFGPSIIKFFQDLP